MKKLALASAIVFLLAALPATSEAGRVRIPFSTAGSVDVPLFRSTGATSFVLTLDFFGPGTISTMTITHGMVHLAAPISIFIL